MLAITVRAKRKHSIYLLYGMKLVGIEFSNYCRQYVINPKDFRATKMIKKKNKPVSVNKGTLKVRFQIVLTTDSATNF
jgi:hypothetical protein